LALKPKSYLMVNSKDSYRSLPNSVRNKKDLWIDLKAYLVVQKQIKSSIRNKGSYAQRFYHILE
jgi:hypothetical protein